MEFKGPEVADLFEVRCINMAYLEYLRSTHGEAQRQRLPGRLRPVVAALTQRQAERLASVPFLLLTLNESDEAYWSRVREQLPVCDLFAVGQDPVNPLVQVVVSALGFQWQLSRKNPYAARLVGGACLEWCEQLAACSLLRVLQCAVDCQRFVAPRQPGNEMLWTRLLGAGLSSADDVRRAAHLAALQLVLAPVHAMAGRQLRSAACHASVPVLEIRGACSVRDNN
ncbi:MAG: hypothetical protein OEW64_03580 [Gammaproteobacteria bacterium]|nr:hypothetical protein [Gammaproteobacteria bacterium]MDH5303158.1 hypothetical protein [Gammaproteobacteria bacterium]MDH5320834.1 hypothetical protein [Gammaproteobacteria bacterium]